MMRIAAGKLAEQRADGGMVVSGGVLFDQFFRHGAHDDVEFRALRIAAVQFPQHAQGIAVLPPLEERLGLLEEEFLARGGQPVHLRIVVFEEAEIVVGGVEFAGGHQIVGLLEQHLLEQVHPPDRRPSDLVLLVGLIDEPDDQGVGGLGLGGQPPAGQVQRLDSQDDAGVGLSSVI